MMKKIVFASLAMVMTTSAAFAADAEMTCTLSQYLGTDGADRGKTVLLATDKKPIDAKGFRLEGKSEDKKVAFYVSVSPYGTTVSFEEVEKKQFSSAYFKGSMITNAGGPAFQLGLPNTSKGAVVINCMPN